jgi:hypothetical protein
MKFSPTKGEKFRQRVSPSSTKKAQRAGILQHAVPMRISGLTRRAEVSRALSFLGFHYNVTEFNDHDNIPSVIHE